MNLDLPGCRPSQRTVSRHRPITFGHVILVLSVSRSLGSAQPCGRLVASTSRHVGSHNSVDGGGRPLCQRLKNRTFHCSITVWLGDPRTWQANGTARLVVVFSRVSQSVMRLCSISQISIFARASASVWAYVEFGFASSSAAEARGVRYQWQIHFLSGSSSAVWPLG